MYNTSIQQKTYVYHNLPLERDGRGFVMNNIGSSSLPLDDPRPGRV